ncbi:MAG: ABC transporter permease, partial [Clostridiales bacterium]
MYGPYFLAAVIMSAMYFIILNIVFSQSIANMTYGLTMQGMFSCGIVVMSFFTIGYMLYINSFLIKRRKKEFGLYAILGLEKRHVGQIILRENFILNICAVAFGLLVGIILGKLVMVVLLMLLHTAPGSYYQISPMALVVTGLLFGGIFILTTFYNLLQVRMANPVDLMQGEKKGERKLRGVIPFTIAGLLLLLSGYGAAILVNSSAAALVLFWPAVLVVIMATWLLFIVGSNFLLTRLQNNKQFYYQPDNFIAVSGLLHRLRQHAGGLAN